MVSKIKSLDLFNRKWFSILLLCLCFLILLGTRLYVNHPITGDEPSYLLMDYSLIHDHDLNLKNNYLNNNYSSFYSSPLSADGQVGAHQYETNSPNWYSIHTIGLPFLILPSFLLFGEWGVVVEMVLISTIVIWLTWLWTLKISKSKKLATIASAGLLVCFFYNGLAGYIYPDMVIAALSLAALLILESRRYDQLLYQFLLGIVAGSLVLVHFKGLAIALPLLLIITYKVWHSHHKIPWLAYVGAVPFIAYYFLSLHHWFGVWDPSQTYSSFNTFSSPLPIISAMLFDSMRGLLVNNPLILLVFAGLPIWYKTNRQSFYIILAVSIPLIGVTVTNNGWQGGYSSTGRYTIDLLPIFIPAIALALSKLSKLWQKTLSGLLFLVTLLISLDAIFTKWPYLSAQTRSPLFVQIQNHIGVALDRLLPTFSDTTLANQTSVLIDHHGVIKIIVDYLVVLALLVYGSFLCGLVKVRKGKLFFG